MLRRVAVIAVFALVAAACTGGGDTSRTSTTAGTSTTTSAAPTTTVPPSTTTTTEPIGLVADPVRSDVSRQAIYFLMWDRFANGDPGNDLAGNDNPAAILEHGFFPTSTGYYHGGDAAGLRQKLPYIAAMNLSAIWITPVFTNRWIQGNGTISGSSAGYHGYWQIDFTEIDPHFGTNQEVRALVDEAHDLGLKVFFDVVTNHTGDVIIYEEGRYGYASKANNPYRDAAGNPFDPALVAGSDAFPELDPAVSFPYTPGFATPDDATVKAPDWLNDVTNYHNRGNSTFTGENSLYGDFFGLDDLFTEKPEVVQGMIDIYTSMIDEFDVDGFRVDTVKHVNDEFWLEWVPAILEHAADAGKADFYLFGEVFGESPAFRSHYTTALGFPAVLDFGFNDAVSGYAAVGVGASSMALHFEDDDWYIDTDSNASMLPKFIGNHDVGRLGGTIRASHPGITDDEALQRMELAFGLLFTTRGVPVVYYGDEQGFVGDGGDRGARQDMFPSRVVSYNDDDLIGTDLTTADDNFDTTHPLFLEITSLAGLRQEPSHPTLVTGAQNTLLAEGPVFAFNRIDRDLRREYVIVANNSDQPVTARIPTMTAEATFVLIHGDGAPDEVTAGPDGVVDMPIAELRLAVYRADRDLPESARAPGIRISRPPDGAEINLPRFRVRADLDRLVPAEVTFAVSVDGGPFRVIGTDDNAPHSVFFDTTPYPDGAVVELMATVRDLSGNRAVDTISFTLIERP